MTKKVSVIIVNFNGMAHIDTCISSVMKQNYSNYEVIFVDNASTDGSLEYSRIKYPGLIFVVNSMNTGYAGGINAGFVQSTGDYIAPLNIDVEVEPNWLLTMVNFLDENPQTGIVTPKLLLFDNRNKNNALGINIHISGISFCRGLGKNNINSSKPERVPGVSGASYVIRRELLDRIGGAPSEWFMCNDDVVISWLIHLVGYDVYCIPEAVAYHKYTLRMNPEKFYSLEKGRYDLLFVTLKPLTLIICFPIFLVTELLIIGYCFVRGKAYVSAKFKAVLLAYRNRAKLRKRRSIIQSSRVISDFQLLKKMKWNFEWEQLLGIMR